MSDDEEECTESFRVNCKACLLTYNCDEHVTYSEWRDLLLAKCKDGDRVSTCHEKANRNHFHAYIERLKGRIDCALKHFEIMDTMPNCQCNKVKGSGFRIAADRGHFYVVCQHKKSQITFDTNWQPCHDYAVKAKWPLDMWRTEKIADDRIVECLAFYKCLDPRDKQMIECTVSQTKQKRKLEAIAERKVRIRAAFKPFPIIPLVEEWYAQYLSELARYKFLILWGPSRTHKTEFVKARLGANVFTHHDCVSWNGYDDEYHTAVVFDDVKSIYKYVSDSRHLFQANDMATVNTSATNCYARQIDVVGKPLVITTNEEPTSDWILANAFILEVAHPLGGRDDR